MSEEKTEMSEGMYLDAMNQLKEMNEKREKELLKTTDELMDLKKDLLSCYGMVRMISMIYHDQPHIEPISEISIMLDTLREYLSQFCEQELCSIDGVVVNE